MLVEWNTIALLWPEIVLIAAATSIFVGGAFTRSRAWWAMAAILSYLAAAVALWGGQGSPWEAAHVFSGPITLDPMSQGLRWLALLMGLVFTLIASRAADPDLASEFFGSLMIIVVGVMLVSSANELVLLFLGFELISIPTYVLLFIGRRDRASAEATMKYFFLSILSSALLLYGLTLLYGIGGTTVIVGNGQVQGIAGALAAGGDASGPLKVLAPLALVLVSVGFGFKLAAAPMQFYAPDVYQGTTNANAGLLAVAPKIAGVVGLVRLIVVAMPSSADFAWQLALVMSVLTMTIGNICALWQNNIRRLMAYSSIAHGGYLLLGLATAAGASSIHDSRLYGGIGAMLFYVFVYALATMGTFAALAFLGSSRREVSGVEELSGLGRSQPLSAAAIAIFMFSLAGLPPLAGFWGKLTIFGSAIEIASAETSGGMAWWFGALAVIGVLNSAIAAAYYLRVVSVMYFQPATSNVAASGGVGAFAAAMLCGVLVVACGAFPGATIDLATRSENALRTSAERTTRAADSPPLVAQQVKPK